MITEYILRAVNFEWTISENRLHVKVIVNCEWSLSLITSAANGCLLHILDLFIWVYISYNV